MIVGVLIARGGSKRIPGKNIKPFAGRPVIEYAAEAAKEAGIFDRLILSTDSEAIAQIARKQGIEVPFFRPAELADDHAITVDVIAHAVRWLNDHSDQRVQYVCGIYATAPFLCAEDLRAGLALLRDSGAATVMPVTTFDFPVFRALTRNDQGDLEMVWPEYETRLSNDLPETYHDAGQFYWEDADVLLASNRLYGQPTKPLILPRHRVQDLDTPEDWDVAERLYHVHQMGAL